MQSTSVYDTYKMKKVRELKIDSTLWATPAKIINLLDFKPEKLSVETKSNAYNDIKVHQVRYENGGFYLTIDNIRGYFNFRNNLGILTMIFANDDQQNKYHQIWTEILKSINRENGELELHEKIKIIDSDLPIEHVFKIPSITIVIKSLIEKNNKFYLELSLNHCLYILNNILVLIKKMLKYDRIDISEGIDINKCKDTSQKCSLCKFYYF